MMGVSGMLFCLVMVIVFSVLIKVGLLFFWNVLIICMMSFLLCLSIVMGLVMLSYVGVVWWWLCGLWFMLGVLLKLVS